MEARLRELEVLACGRGLEDLPRLWSGSRARPRRGAGGQCGRRRPRRDRRRQRAATGRRLRRPARRRRRRWPPHRPSTRRPRPRGRRGGARRSRPERRTGTAPGRADEPKPRWSKASTRIPAASVRATDPRAWRGTRAEDDARGPPSWSRAVDAVARGTDDLRDVGLRQAVAVLERQGFGAPPRAAAPDATSSRARAATSASPARSRYRPARPRPAARRGRAEAARRALAAD